jgi:hypothetical protein
MHKMKKYIQYFIGFLLQSVFKYSQVVVVVETKNDHNTITICAGFISFQVINHAQSSSG